MLQLGRSVLQRNLRGCDALVRLQEVLRCGCWLHVLPQCVQQHRTGTLLTVDLHTRGTPAPQYSPVHGHCTHGPTCPASYYPSINHSWPHALLILLPFDSLTGTLFAKSYTHVPAS